MSPQQGEHAFGRFGEISYDTIKGRDGVTAASTKTLTECVKGSLSLFDLHMNAIWGKWHTGKLRLCMFWNAVDARGCISSCSYTAVRFVEGHEEKKG